MENDKAFKFRVSAALKSLIGKELITDQFIAIFELVKNAFDAHAQKVTITFEDIYGENPRIIIKDNGKGMDYEDLRDKWLFVAYSAKKDGTEDSSIIDTKDYREYIKNKRIFAGAKGVGRFSCDRLGNKLNLITIKDKEDAKTENITVNWGDFEKDAKEEFVDIPIIHKELDTHNYEISHGTVLEMSELRDKWDRSGFLKLRRSLEKLINPNQDNDVNNFSIELIVDEEKTKDERTKDKWNKVNGIIENSLFEKLGIKTTQIVTEISEDNTLITTTIMDRGKLIYKITEKNNYTIGNIKIHLFQLSREAKNNFTRIMGIESVNYGSVFMYKNGFRIYPFGEVGEDIFGIDRRKAQGKNRYLGTRDLIGRIEIFGDNEGFIESTSRDGGLIKNNSYFELEKFFNEKTLRRLEKYAVNIIKWGDPYKVNEDDIERQPALNPEDVKEKIRGIIANLSRTKDVLSVEYENDFLDRLEKSQENSVSNVIKDIARIANDTNNDDLLNHVGKLNENVKSLVGANIEYEKEIDEKTSELVDVKEELGQRSSENLFLKSVMTTDKKEIVSLQHQIDHGTDRIRRNLDKLTDGIRRAAPKDELLNYIERISLENEKISTIAKFVTKANFNLMSQTITKDLVLFINQYIENVYKDYTHLKINKQMLNVTIKTPPNLRFEYTFKPLELIIIIDNLFSNSNKANANNVELVWEPVSNKKLRLKFIDDGIGISIKEINTIFEFGYTTTDGSGIGLYHVKQIIDKMGGKISVNNQLEKGVEFILEVQK